MAPGLFWIILFSVISLSLASNWNSKICTKQLLRKFYIHRMDSNTHRIVSQEKSRKSIIFVCCEGFRERSRRNELPNCEPICKQSCGYGYCYRPNLCACYYGYELSNLDGTCKRIGRVEVVTKSRSSSLDTRLEIESSTRHMDTKTSSTAADLIHDKFFSTENSALETTISTRKQLNRSEIAYGNSDLGTTNLASTKIESSTKQIDLGPSLGAVDDFPRVQFITHGSFGLGTANPISVHHTSFEVESTTKQVDLRSSLRAVDDFPRVQFITHEGFGLGTANPISVHHKSYGAESSTKQIDLKPSVTAVDDFRRLHGDSRFKLRNPANTESLEVESSRPRTYEKPILVNDAELAKKSPTKININNVASFYEFKNPANCTGGVCTCQMGYQLFAERFCQPCQIGSQCQCRDGYAFDSFLCRPLCNGVFDGCIRGTCIEYNQCSCINGTEKYPNDIFRCFYKEASIFDQSKIIPKWYPLLLLISGGIAILSFCIIIERSRTSKLNRLKAQRNTFQEIRYFHTNNNHFVQRKYQGTDEKILNESGFGQDVIEHDGNILILKV